MQSSRCKGGWAVFLLLQANLILGDIDIALHMKTYTGFSESDRRSRGLNVKLDPGLHVPEMSQLYHDNTQYTYSCTDSFNHGIIGKTV